MAQYTILTAQELKSIVDNYDINNILSFKVLNGGIENTNYLVNADNGKFVLTVCEQKSALKTRELAHLLEHLEKHHFQTSKIFRTRNNETITLWKGKPVIIKKFIGGKIIKHLSPELLLLLGKELGKLHKVTAPLFLPKKLNYGIENFDLVNKYAAEAPFNYWLKDIINYLTPFLKMGLPKALIHSDIFCDNVIVSEDERSVTIMDFEEAAIYYRIFDIGMMIIGTCSEEKTINLKKASFLLKGYEQEIELLDEEINALQAFTIYAGTAMTFWRHKNFNYTKPDPEFADHYLGLKILVDYIRGLSPEYFLDTISNNKLS
jgi:homoserine kinase type II